MTTRRKKLTEEIKAGIRAAAAELFAEKGYPYVTMREIAKAAGCSHTAIYLYFKNKEDLLQQIAIPPLEEMDLRMQSLLADPEAVPTATLLAICREYIVFCLTNASMHKVLISSGSERVDEPEPALEVNRIRNRLFAHMMTSLKRVVDEDGGMTAEEALTSARVLFYYVQGFVSTYSDHSEPLDSLLDRTLPIMEDGVRILVLGLKEKYQAKTSNL